jgi:hypothetical protein
MKRESSSIVSLKPLLATDIELVKQLRRKIRQKIREAKNWQELLQADVLTISGNVAWKENQQSSRVHVRKEKKKKKGSTPKTTVSKIGMCKTPARFLRKAKEKERI